MQSIFKVLSASLVLSFLGALPSTADLRVDFRESAPKDRFTIENIGSCALGPLEVTLDLSTAKGGLIFDTTASGAGVEVYQPFEWVSGKEYATAVSTVSDGQSSILLSLSGLAPKSKLAFTIDVDDTLTNSVNGQIRVAGSEIEGAGIRVRLASQDASQSGVFGLDAEALVALNTCSS